MKRTVLTYGLISGVVAAALMLAHVPFMDGSREALIIGYARIVLAALLIFFGVRAYLRQAGRGTEGGRRAAAEDRRDGAGYANPFVNVAFTFIEPFPVGLLMTLISAIILRRQ